MARLLLILLGCATFSVLSWPTIADDRPGSDEQTAGEAYDGQTDDGEVLFTRHVAGLLRTKCLGCHGQDTASIEGGFDVRSRDAILRGGESEEPGLIAGNAEASAIYLAAVRQEDLFSAMPPKESEALSDEELGWLRDWIEAGAAWPSEERQREIETEYADRWSVEDGVIVATSGGLDDAWTSRRYDPAGLWAYQPLANVFVEQNDVSPIDQLIRRQLPDGLTVAARADRRTLIRRVGFDLTGLPPTADEIAAFVDDPSEDAAAFATVVDRLLASPHYGEKMAQHWLDVTRYADSSGFSNDYERGTAWRYRDYVVRAFNDDKPYDEFVREQIAGDELLHSDDGDPNPEGLIATGFLRMGPWELTSMEVPRVARQRFLDDVTNSVGETFLGHALKCASCHDHKFDPIPTQDYYGLQAVFATTQLVERDADFLPEENTDHFEEQRYLKQRQQFYYDRLADLDTFLLEQAQVWYRENKRDPADWNDAVDESRKARSWGIFGQARNRMKNRKVAEDAYPPNNVGFGTREFGINADSRKGLQRLAWELDRFEPYAFSVYNGYTPTVTTVTKPVRMPKNPLDESQTVRDEEVIRTGGDPFAKGGAVPPQALSVLNAQLEAVIPTTVNGRRSALAEWVADPRNALTTRVIANRVWQWHFGRAIAGNPNNFGSTGAKPSHPELLDYLATSLLENGWSIKSLHRQILLSEAYARSTQHPDADRLRELDPLDQSYAVFRPRRLTAEELRDAMLFASGELNPEIGGVPIRPIINREVAEQPRLVMGSIAAAWVPSPHPDERNRRTLYVQKLRGLATPMLEVFNAPGPDFSCELRDASTVTPQVFALFNSESIYSRSLALAKRATEATSNRADAVGYVFKTALGRGPTEDEFRDVLAHWHHLEAALPLQPRPVDEPRLTLVREAREEKTGERYTFEEPLFSNADFVPDVRPQNVDRATRALGDICLVLLNSNEFAFVY